MTVGRENQNGIGAIPDEPDEHLLARIADMRDRQAFVTLFHRYASSLKWFMVRGGLQVGEAEEATQDVLVSIWRRASQFDAAKAGARSWIYAIARNRRIDSLRKRARPSPDPEDPLFKPDPDPSAETLLAHQDRDGAVRVAITDLTPDQRETIRLSFYDGLSHSEIAAQLDVPLGTIKSRLRLAFGKLRVSLGDGFDEELTE